MCLFPNPFLIQIVSVRTEVRMREKAETARKESAIKILVFCFVLISLFFNVYISITLNIISNVFVNSRVVISTKGGRF